MIVTHENLREVVQLLRKQERVGFDCETRGKHGKESALRPYHGARLFSFALAARVGGEVQGFYFNFQNYPGLPREYVLDKRIVFPYLQRWLFDREHILWFAHNAKFDLHFLAQEKVSLKGPVHCTQVMGRVEYNYHAKYDLDSSLERIGLEKDSAVEQYIEEHQLYELVEIPGRKKREKNKFFHLVPFEIMHPYCVKDTVGALLLGESQIEKFDEMAAQTPEGLPTVWRVVENERRLTKTLTTIERNGCRIDRGYCIEAARYTKGIFDSARAAMQDAASRDFTDHANFYAELFKGHEHEFSRTEKGGLSFDKFALKKITHPMVGTLQKYRVAQNRFQFYSGFLYHADANDRVHPSFNADVVKHGRLSCSNPNFQNLKADDIDDFTAEELESEYFVRRAIIPSEGNVLLMPDYVNMEYKMYLEYICILAGKTVPLAQKVNDGMNFHDAVMEALAEKGYDIKKKVVKICNFLTIYEGGPGAVVQALGCTMKEARDFQRMIHEICPQGKETREAMMKTARQRGFIFNWLGRRCYFPVSKFAYRSANYVISGGCAEAMKIALNETQDSIEKRGWRAKLISTIHDEMVGDVPKKEAFEVAKEMAYRMEKAFPARYVPMTVDMEWSDRSMFDKVKGFPFEDSGANQGAVRAS